jgi:F-type H+-transporting ATPase subunit delta
LEATQVAHRYARGLFELTQEKKVSDSVHEDLISIADLLEHDRTLLNFLAAPQLLDSDKEAVVEKVFSGKVQDDLYSFMRLLVEKRRTDFLVEIAKEYERLFNESRGLIATRLITAVPLTEVEKQQIIGKLNALTRSTVTLIPEVDPGIIAGAIAVIGDKIIDRSVRHDLRELREQLMELKVH